MACDIVVLLDIFADGSDFKGDFGGLYGIKESIIFIFLVLVEQTRWEKSVPRH